jgi:acyl-CoA reductase-like NAD-dependent aldehyde dehydrogenase
MIAHPVPRMVSFTGSVAVGRQVAVEAARGLKRVVLELGGNDAAIVLDDADVDVVAEGLFWGAFQNNGQVCSAIKRVYAPDHLVDELAKSVAEVAARVEIGPGTERGSQLGPLGNRGQFERVTDLVDEAVAGGARAVVGGRPLQREGFFFPPTILTGAADDSRIVAEEQFGPVLPILGYRDLDDAVRRANATEFGLSGSVWGESSERAAEVAARLECGTAWVNTHLVLLPEQPFGGTKWSGMGIENGHWGVDAFSNLQVVHCLHS